MLFFKNKYLIAGLLLYSCAILYLYFAFQQPPSDFLGPFIIVGIGFSLIAWLLTKHFERPAHKPSLKNETVLLLLLICWIIFYITYGSSLINQLLPKAWIENAQTSDIVIFLKKLLFFVAIPFIIYTILGFSLQDFGLKSTPVNLFSKKAVSIFIVLSIAGLAFQYYLGNGSKPVRDGQFSGSQLLTGLPLCFIYLFFDAGLIEEFFFRGLLQSRLSVLLKSCTGGIMISAVIFGLVHAPGLYLRGAESEGISEQLPLLFWASYTIAFMSVAGIFLGIIWNKTKNLWLVMAIHAALDLLPNFTEFAHTWKL